MIPDSSWPPARVFLTSFVGEDDGATGGLFVLRL